MEICISLQQKSIMAAAPDQVFPGFPHEVINRWRSASIDLVDARSLLGRASKKWRRNAAWMRHSN
jgi:hypothetical protein